MGKGLSHSLYGGCLLSLLTVREEHPYVAKVFGECLRSIKNRGVWVYQHPHSDNHYIVLRPKDVVCVPDWKFWSSVATLSFNAGSNYPFDKIWIYDPNLNVSDDRDKLSQPHRQHVYKLLEYEYVSDTPAFKDFGNFDKICWGFVTDEIGHIFATKIKNAVGMSEQEKSEQPDSYAEKAKNIVRDPNNNIQQSILDDCYLFGQLADDVCHPFWTILKSLLSIILLMALNDWGFAQICSTSDGKDKVVEWFATLGVPSITKQVRKYLNQGPAHWSTPIQISAQGDQLKVALRNIHLFLIKGAQLLPQDCGDVPELLWATLWVFFIEFRYVQLS